MIRVVAAGDGPDWRAFHAVAETVYAGDAHWVAPLRRDLQAQLASDADFVSYGRREIFIAWRGDHPVGRCVAAINERLLERESEPVGLLGYFECVDDVEVAKALFDAAKTWLAAAGMHRIRGPIDLSTHIRSGCLVDGFERAPFIMMPYNPSYYGALFERDGWTKAKDAFAYDFVVSDRLTGQFERAYQIATKAGVTFRPVAVKGAAFERDCRELYRVFNESFEQNWSSTARTEAEFMSEARGLRLIADPAIFPIAEFNGQMIGFWMGLPDINVALRHARGRLGPRGVLAFLWHRRRIDRARVLAVGVVPEFQRARYAVGPALVYAGMRGGTDKKRPYRRAELSWVWEDNRRSQKLIETAGGQRYKTYRVYERAISR